MIKKTYLEKKECTQISKIIPADNNKSLHYKHIFNMKQNLSQEKKMSISKHGGAYGLPYSDTVHFTCPHPFCTVNVWMKILNDSTQAFIT